MKIRQLLESATGMSTASVATVTKGSKGMIKRQKPTDNALDSGKLFQETNAAEGKDDKIAQLKKDHDTAVHWSKNEKSPQKREAARQKAEKIKRHLDTQYKQGVAEGSEQIGELSTGTLNSYVNKARNQVRASPGSNPNNSHLPTDPKIAKRARGAVKADNRLNGFGPVKKPTQDVDESRVDELSKDTLKSYVPKRIEKTKGLAKTDYNKAHHIIKKDIPRAMSKLKDPNYGKEQPTSPVEENKKGVRAVKHTTKPRNFVAKNAGATTSGAGAHKNKKKEQEQGKTKHKGKEPAYESKLWAALDRRIIK